MPATLNRPKGAFLKSEMVSGCLGSREGINTTQNTQCTAFLLLKENTKEVQASAVTIACLNDSLRGLRNARSQSQLLHINK